MQSIYQHGVHRCIEPKHSFPDSAWKLDNSMTVNEGEILIEVSLLNIDANSFKQLYVESQGETSKIAAKIMEIINLRGKLHNPLTGTGGILYGKVLEMHPSYPNSEGVSIGDYVISLTSLALTPIKIHRILDIDHGAGQVSVEGKAILFANSPLIRAPKHLPLKLLLALLDEAGAAINSYKLARENYSVLILGASGELGLMCAHAVRKKLGKTGRIIGVRSSKDDSRFRDQTRHIFDDIYSLDVLKPTESFEKINVQEASADLTINCINSPGAEILSIMCTKKGGSIYLASLAPNYKTLCLSLEGMAKDINIIGYKGYTEGHAAFTIELLQDNPSLAELLSERLKKNYQKDSIGNKLYALNNLDNNLLKNISLEDYVFASAEMQKVLDNALKVSNYDCTVLITGESGVGKEIIASIIHKSSDRSMEPSIKINCGSIPKDLLEAELFGYEKGAFTGADKQGKLGFFEIASGGTLFLDEIGELPINLQVKLLRALQEKEIYRVGGTKPVKVDVRIITATNKNLQKLMLQGEFREDLYYRLNVFPIEIPPLRQRREDIEPLIKLFTEKYNQRFKLKKIFEKNAVDYMQNYPWPGNIRELENVIQRLLISINSDVISLPDVAKNIQSNEEPSFVSSNHFSEGSFDEIMNMKEFEILKHAKEKFKTTRKIAEALQLSQTTLVRKLKKYGL